ncbi:hypothetical protein SAMN05192554_11028 [Haloarchaeobius iranensis]|uniref:Uncharacterized protein n=2 Tax=Haloarchaeobius iranensis TaxID=996166 RepID=A0A1G9XBC0_9EURY|nr:hypothetical protein SAMN05192554_11028 [Haloarchaeobius iranensis]
MCGSAVALAGTIDNHSKEELRTKAKAHLAGHSLDESKAALRKHEVVAEAEEVIVSEANFDRLPTAEWRPPAETWLPDAVTATRATDRSQPVVTQD